MITSGFLYIVFGLVNVITIPLRSAADVSLPSSLLGAISSIGAYLIALDTYIPISTIIAILALVLIVDTSIFGYKLTMWVVKRFPTQS